MSVILTSSAYMPSRIMARRKSLSLCMLPWVMARLCALDLGSGEVRISFLGHGLIRFSLPGMDQ